MDFEEFTAVTAGKRLAMNWTPWMGDWFVAHSPRNGNTHAEGQWDQWVDLALKILQHDATAIIRPEAHAAVAEVPVHNFYSEVAHSLTDEQVESLFGDKAATV